MTSHNHTHPENHLIYNVSSDGVAHITLNKPHIRNAFDSHLIEALTNTFESAGKDSNVLVILLSSSSENFSAGADLNWMKSMVNASYEENLYDAQKLELLMSTINTCTKPVVTKVCGAVYGGGVGLLACSDIVIAETNASFALSEVKLGLSPATIAPFVIDAIGARAARRLFLTGEVFTANHALTLGLVSEVVPSERLDKTIAGVIAKLLANGPKALTITKALITEVKENPRGQTLTDYTCKLIAKLRVSDEGQEGLSAFLEKRKPAWSAVSKVAPSTSTTTPSISKTTPSASKTTPSDKAD